MTQFIIEKLDTVSDLLIAQGQVIEGHILIGDTLRTQNNTLIAVKGIALGLKDHTSVTLSLESDSKLSVGQVLVKS